MTTKILSLALCGTLAAGLSMSAPVAQAAPGGCLKYGVAGAVAGHAVHHGVKGFLAGCAAGMYRRHLYNKQMREQKALPKPAPAGTPAGDRM
jgi:hypothetical protein